MATEDIYPQLFLELNNGFGDARLRCKQRLGGIRQVEILSDRLADKTKLMEILARTPVGSKN